jgi:hypothetical protein
MAHLRRQSAEDRAAALRRKADEATAKSDCQKVCEIMKAHPNLIAHILNFAHDEVQRTGSHKMEPREKAPPPGTLNHKLSGRFMKDLCMADLQAILKELDNHKFNALHMHLSFIYS